MRQETTAMPPDMSPLLQDVATFVPWMQDRAAALDCDAVFPDQEIERLHRIGALTIPLPVQVRLRDDALADALATLLILVGQGNLSVGRVLEAHINTMHLVARYGTEAQRRETDAAVCDGCLFGLWVTDPPAGGLRMTRSGSWIRLHGAKQ